MHTSAYQFVQKILGVIGKPPRVLEIGSLNVNGTIRGLFNGAAYTGVDVQAGPLVDVVADGATYQTAEPVDCVVCCEVLEHAANWQGIIVNAAHLLRTGGYLIVTAAAKPRPAHSALDGGSMRQGEYYENIDPQDLSMFAQHFGLHIVMLEYDGVAGDVRLLAVKYG